MRFYPLRHGPKSLHLVILAGADNRLELYTASGKIIPFRHLSNRAGPLVWAAITICHTVTKDGKTLAYAHKTKNKSRSIGLKGKQSPLATADFLITSLLQPASSFDAPFPH